MSDPCPTVSTHVYVTAPADWTPAHLKAWAPTCGKCGMICRRWRWIGRAVQAYRCADCDAVK